MRISRQLIFTFLLSSTFFCFLAVDVFSQIKKTVNKHNANKNALPIIRKTVSKPLVDSSLFYEYHPEDSTLNVYTTAEILAEPTGGSKGFNKFVSDSTRYPLDERECSITGRVIISFIIEKDGQLSNVKILKGASPGFDAEAIRLFKSMPKWYPAMNNGKTVRIHYSVPLFFNLKDQ